MPAPASGPASTCRLHCGHVTAAAGYGRCHVVWAGSRQAGGPRAILWRWRRRRGAPARHYKRAGQSGAAGVMLRVESRHCWGCPQMMQMGTACLIQPSYSLLQWGVAHTHRSGGGCPPSSSGREVMVLGRAEGTLTSDILSGLFAERRSVVWGCPSIYDDTSV